MMVGIGMATGKPIFGRFEIDEPGAVVNYVGEGGRHSRARPSLRQPASSQKPELDAPAKTHHVHCRSWAERLRPSQRRPQDIALDRF